MTYDELENRFQAVAGLVSLDATDKFFLLNSLNVRARDAWSRAQWPELISIDELTLSAVGQFAKASPVVTKDILNCYDKSPWIDQTAQTVFYTLIDGRIVLDPNYPGTKLFALVKAPFIAYTESSVDIPTFLESHLISAILSDFFRGDGAYDKANAEEQRSEEFLLRQMDRVEKTQQQNTPLVGSYNRIQSRQIYQTT